MPFTMMNFRLNARRRAMSALDLRKNDTAENGAVKKDDSIDRKSASSSDLTTAGKADPETSTKRRKKVLNSFRKLKKIRSKSRERSAEKNLKKQQSESAVDELKNGNVTDEEKQFDKLFDSTDQKGASGTGAGSESDRNRAFQNERSFSDPGMLPQQSLEEKEDKNEKEDTGNDVDSGIATDEHTTTKSPTHKKFFTLPRVGHKKESEEAALIRQRHAELKKYPFFELEVILKEGRDLVVRDACGTSDPYVKFKLGHKELYKSRTIHKNLNPAWNEKFILPIEDPFHAINVKCYDWDRGVQDDSMGFAEIKPSDLPLNTLQEMKLMLSEAKSKEGYMGYILLSVKLVPKTQDEKEQHSPHTSKGGIQCKTAGKFLENLPAMTGVSLESAEIPIRKVNTTLLAEQQWNHYFLRASKMAESGRNKKGTYTYSSIVHIVLVEGKNLIPMDDNGLSDPFVKLRLGNEKFKGKPKMKTLNPRWKEQCELYMYDNQTSTLEVTVWDFDVADKNDLMGRATVDLTTLDREVTHTVEVKLEDGAGVVVLLVTITGTQGSETGAADLSDYLPDGKAREEIVRKYGVAKSFKNIRDVGWLQCKVFKAQSLASADIGGKSDPFCVLEVVNARRQTHTEYKTLCPEWGKIFTFPVRDIHSMLEITVYDEDRDRKFEFLGKVVIPLLRIKNGEKRWYALKDKKLNRRVKGAVQLEMDFIYNHLKAAIRTVNPREEKYMQPRPQFKIAVMKRNIDRLTQIIDSAVEGGVFLQSCFNWESKPRSIAAFIVFLILTWTFELYMAPLTLFIVFVFQLIITTIISRLNKDAKEDEYFDEDDEEEEEVKDPKDEKKGFKEKLQQIQEICLQVQEGMDMAASMGERVKNTFNWTVPWLSMLACLAMLAGTFLLYYVPVRYILLLWGINKFTKKLRAPNAIPNNELLDYLSRVPSDKELLMYRELRPDFGNTPPGKKKRS
ncbi:multiple C2 and transmembrane domain-containing protein 1-like isoform X2 [Tubulanus polymorphus]|uniref:multiple C2 and transmembrane domain-containing protein 1-like isoform X2 n=1 Tax=Tubulanus polymorphus TaxID=672921 RepID=UPI003DA2B25B